MSDVLAVGDRLNAAIQDAYSFAEPTATIDEVRAGYDVSMSRGGLPETAVARPRTVGGVPGLFIETDAEATQIIVFFHGGGYVFGSSVSHRDLAAQLALAAGANVFVADYRRAPEDQFPAAVDDAVAVLTGLLAEGVPASEIVFAGDSAGGGLAFAGLLAARDRGVAMPSAVVAMSAWVDLALESGSISTNADRDPVCQRAGLEFNASHYLGNHDPRDPLASPVYADLSGLPPAYLQMGSDDALRDDASRLADAIERVGGSVEAHPQAGMGHVHQILWWILPEARTSVNDAGAFIRRRKQP